MLGTVPANNYPQIPCLASTYSPGHMRSSLFGRNFPLYTRHVESVVFGAHRKGLPGITDHSRTGHWQIATAASGPDGAAGWAQAGQWRGAGPESPQQYPLQESYTENADRSAKIIRIRRGDPLRCGRTCCITCGAAVRSGWSAARFLIMNRVTCLCVPRDGIGRTFRSGSFTFAYSTLIHDSNYEALLTLAAKFYCWRIHFCRRIQPT